MVLHPYILLRSVSIAGYNHETIDAMPKEQRILFIYRRLLPCYDSLDKSLIV